MPSYKIGYSVVQLFFIRHIRRCPEYPASAEDLLQDFAIREPRLA
jgi:hypothetical protein